MKGLTVLYVVFVAGAFTGFLTPCRSAWSNRRAARADTGATGATGATGPALGGTLPPPRRRKVRS